MNQVRLRASTVCIHENKLLVFRAIDPHSGTEYFFLPGGRIEETEDARLCAERETLEETGLKVRVIPHSEVVKKYMFRWDNADHFCQTHFFRAELRCDPEQPRPVNDADYHKGACWLPLEAIDETFKYSRPIFQAVQELAVYRVRE